MKLLNVISLINIIFRPETLFNKSLYYSVTIPLTMSTGIVRWIIGVGKNTTNSTVKSTVGMTTKRKQLVGLSKLICRVHKVCC